MESIGPGIAFALLLLAIVLAIAWIVVPFAIIGTKPLLRQLLEQQIRTNQLLHDLQRRQLASSMPELGGGAAESRLPAPR